MVDSGFEPRYAPQIVKSAVIMSEVRVNSFWAQEFSFK